MHFRLKAFLRGVLPSRLKTLIKRSHLGTNYDYFHGLTTKQSFTEIYRTKAWGDHGDFFSGWGSTSEVSRQYCNLIRNFVTEYGIERIIDLGCGDFRVGQNLLMDGIKYVGIDIVDEMIDSHIRRFGDKNTVFKCLDITIDELPEGDVCLVRQVLQHLSNREILEVLKQISRYSYVIVTEHHPSNASPIVPNIDKPHGPDTRLHENSGVYLDKPPFNRPNMTLLLETDLNEFADGIDNPGVLRTWLLDQNH